MTNDQHHETNRSLLIALIVIGIITLIVLLAGRYGTSRIGYVNGTQLTGSALQFDTAATDHYYYPTTATAYSGNRVIYTNSGYASNQSYTSGGYTYTRPGQTIVVPEGCTSRSGYSTTTGIACNTDVNSL